MNGNNTKSNSFKLPDNIPAGAVFFAAFTGLIVLWIVEMVLLGLPVSLKGILEIHYAHPTLLLADLIPFFITYIIHKLTHLRA